jgi:hypothetical protein
VVVDDQRRRDDLYEVNLRPHDERVEVGGWTYYVRAVKRESKFTLSSGWLTTVLLIDVPLLLFRAVRRLFGRRPPWIVGVARLGSVKTWNDLTPKVVHREVLQQDVDPVGRIAELVDQASAGQFAPESLTASDRAPSRHRRDRADGGE